jgi:iron complex transport system ATP-binding protein
LFVILREAEDLLLEPKLIETPKHSQINNSQPWNSLFTMPNPFVELEHVTVVRGEREVLHDISFAIREGEQIALLGPNGCGKSTLLKTLTCELYPLARPAMRVSLFGRERWDVTELKKRLGVVQNELPGKPMLKIGGLEAVLTGFFSSSTLWPNLVVTDEMRSRAEAMLDRVGASMLRDHRFGEMSSGQQRRILIARALVASAGCLLLDEPSNTLDLAAQRELRALMRTLAQQGTTILLITHQVADIIPEMKRVVMMRDGRIVADGPRATLLTEDRLSELFATDVRLTHHEGFFHAW